LRPVTTVEDLFITLKYLNGELKDYRKVKEKEKMIRGKRAVCLMFFALILVLSMTRTSLIQQSLHPAFANATGPYINLPSGTVTVTFDYPYTLPNGTTVSYWEITLSNVPSGYDVTNRTYVGWCCDETYTIYNGQTIPNMKLYSSYDPSQPWEANLTDWSKVNYIINHKQGTWDEVQAAIWHYIDHNGGNQADPTVIAMEEAADRNPNFVPSAGQLLAVVVYLAGEQSTFIEVVVRGMRPEPVILAITPPKQEFVGPCIVSTTFTINVSLWNVEQYTGVGVYAWDFNVSWSPNVGISLVSVTLRYPTQPAPNATGPLNYFLIDSSFSNADGWYHLAETLMPTTTDPYPELNNVNYAPLVTLTFHIDDEPCYPWTLSTPFTLSFQPPTGGLASGCKQPDVITYYELDNGEYSISAAPPDVHITSPAAGPLPQPLYEGAPWYNVTEGVVGASIEIDVWLSNVTHCYGFFVDLTWDNWYKVTNVQSIQIGPMFKLTSGDYTLESIYNATVPGAEMGELWIWLVRPLEKPLICGVNVLAFTITFTTVCPNPIPTTTTLLPFAIKSASILCAPTLPGHLKGYGVVYGENIYSTLPLWGPLSPGYDGISCCQPLIYSCNIADYWRPKQADLDYDGVVNVADLAMVAADYGKPLGTPPTGSPYPMLIPPPSTMYDGFVNIYDVAYVAKNYGN
jgi:hypothetical protein